MRRNNPRAVECLDAVRLAGDPVRLQQAPADAPVAAAAVLAKGLVAAIDAGGLRAQRAAALDMLDNAGRTIRERVAQTELNARPRFDPRAAGVLVSSH